MDEELCDNNYIVIKGTIVDGLGEGAKYVHLYTNNILKVLGIKPYPGTLNVLVGKEYIDIARDALDLRKATHIVPPPLEGFGKVYVWKAYVDCIQAYIVRPEITSHGNNVIEVISDTFLRRTLGKKSGESVIIAITYSGAIPCFCL